MTASDFFAPKVRVRFGVFLLAAGTVGWPLSALTVARHEPQVVLGLSWVAILLAALSWIESAYVNQRLDENGS